MGVCSPRRLFAWLGSALPPSLWHKAAPERSEGRGGRSSSGCIARCRTAQPGDVCEMLPPSPELFPGSPSSPNRGSGWFLIIQGQQSCPAIHLCTQHPLQEMFLPRAAQVPGWLRPCVPGHPSWRSVLITFIHCNQGKESIDSLSSHFCQFFRRHH